MHPSTLEGHPNPGSPRLPSGWQWPAFVVSLLVASVLTMMGFLFLANQDGGAQVIDNYYQKAVDWDEQKAEKARSAALGWSARLDVAPDQRLTLFIQNVAGQPVLDARVTLVAFRPQYADAQAKLELILNPATGAYEAMLPVAGAGLWDFEIRALRDSSVFITTIRKTL
jgi:nitrogen fixation protein FixH